MLSTIDSNAFTQNVFCLLQILADMTDLVFNFPKFCNDDISEPHSLSKNPGSGPWSGLLKDSTTSTNLGDPDKNSFACFCLASFAAERRFCCPSIC